MNERRSTKRDDILQTVGGLSSPRLRDQHQALTRRAILQAARELFGQRGYAATPVKEIAARAGTAVQTIYDAFGSKAGVAVGLADLVDEETGMVDLLREIVAADDPRRALREVARHRRNVRERCGDIVRTLRSGAEAESDLAAAWAEGRRRRHSGVAFLTDRFAEQGALQEGLTAVRAADIALALTCDEVCDVLVEQRGWSFDEYEAWLGDTLVGTLLR